MGIRVSERTDPFHVPYGPLNSEGTLGTGFVDLKANPAWIPVIPSCLGWPETQSLLEVVNSPTSSLMTLAADQALTVEEQPDRNVVLTSFVTLCRADLGCRGKSTVAKLAKFLQSRLDTLLQNASTGLHQSLFLEMLLEVQPTVFHDGEGEGWSLTVVMAASGEDERQARRTWGVGMRALQRALIEHEPSIDPGEGKDV